VVVPAVVPVVVPVIPPTLSYPRCKSEGQRSRMTPAQDHDSMVTTSPDHR
jgi:hypothetical protein